MTEEEALIRAREAVIALNCFTADDDQVRAGQRDDYPTIQAIVRALLDLDKPLPVDRDLADLREIMAARFSTLDDLPEEYRRGDYDTRLRDVIPTFRAIIQRRIDEIVELGK